MKDEYDFSTATRGKFYKTDSEYLIPVYLDQEVQAVLLERASQDGATLNDVANDLIRIALAITATEKTRAAE
jgi:hypothetical protein